MPEFSYLGHKLLFLPSSHNWLKDKDTWESVFSYLEYDGMIVEMDAKRLQTYIDFKHTLVPDMIGSVLSIKKQSLILADVSSEHGRNEFGTYWDFDVRNRTMVSAINALLRKLTAQEPEKKCKILALIGSNHQHEMSRYLVQGNFQKPFFITEGMVHLNM